MTVVSSFSALRHHPLRDFVQIRHHTELLLVCLPNSLAFRNTLLVRGGGVSPIHLNNADSTCAWSHVVNVIFFVREIGLAFAFFSLSVKFSTRRVSLNANDLFMRLSSVKVLSWHWGLRGC